MLLLWNWISCIDAPRNYTEIHSCHTFFLTSAVLEHSSFSWSSGLTVPDSLVIHSLPVNPLEWGVQYGLVIHTAFILGKLWEFILVEITLMVKERPLFQWSYWMGEMLYKFYKLITGRHNQGVNHISSASHLEPLEYSFIYQPLDQLIHHFQENNAFELAVFSIMTTTIFSIPHALLQCNFISFPSGSGV